MNACETDLQKNSSLFIVHWVLQHVNQFHFRWS